MKEFAPIVNCKGMLVDTHQSRRASILQSGSQEDSVASGHDAVLGACDSMPNHGEFETKTAVKQQNIHIHMLSTRCQLQH